MVVFRRSTLSREENTVPQAYMYLRKDVGRIWRELTLHFCFVVGSFVF